MTPVLPATRFRPTDNRPVAPGWRAAATPGSAVRADGGIIRQNRPERQSPGEATGRVRLRLGALGLAAIQVIHDPRSGGMPPPAGGITITTRVCPPGTGHTPEEGQ